MERIEEIAAEKRNLKSTFTVGFNNELNEILEKCFLEKKSKKEHFITKEKLEVELIRLLLKQKRFKPTDSIKQNLCNTSVFDLIDNCVGKIISINFSSETVNFTNMFGKSIVRTFEDVKFFDRTTIAADFYFNEQKKVYDSVDYKKYASFLFN